MDYQIKQRGDRHSEVSFFKLCLGMFWVCFGTGTTSHCGVIWDGYDGNYVYIFRIMLKHEMLLEPANLNLIKWIYQIKQRGDI